MRVGTLRPPRAATILAALALVLAVLLLAGGRAQAQIDLSGTWDVTITGDRSDTCTSAYTQDGTALHTDTVCATYGAGPFDGTIDLSTGVFGLSGTLTNELGTAYQIDVLGTASPDGNTIGGAWSVPAESLSGTFVGVRQPGPETPSPSPTAAASGTPALAPTATPGAGAVILPDTGSGPGGGSGNLPVVPLLGLGAAAPALCALGLRLRRQPRQTSVSQTTGGRARCRD